MPHIQNTSIPTAPAQKSAVTHGQLSCTVYVLVWLSLKGSVAVLLPFFALLCGWSSPQPEKHPPKLSMIPLLVTLAAVTRVARRFASTVCAHSFFQCVPIIFPASYAAGAATGCGTPAACCAGHGHRAETPHCPWQGWSARRPAPWCASPARCCRRG